MGFIGRFAKVFAIPSLLFVFLQAAQSQPPSIYRLPAGTRITLSMDTEIGSRVASVNDTFTATVAKPVIVQDVIVLPLGTVIEGRVLKVRKAGFGGRDGSLQVRFETIRFPDGRKRVIKGVLVNDLKPASGSLITAAAIIGGTAAGALAGAASRSDNGPLIGAGIGAGAGVGVAFLRKGKDVFIRTDEKFEIELKSEVTLPVDDY